MTYVPNEKRYEGMEYRRCGDSGLSLPPVSLGTWQNFGGVNVFETCRAIVRRAFDRVVTHYDLANMYGPPYGSARSEGVEAFIKQMVASRGVTEDQVVEEFFNTVRPTSIIKRFICPQEVAGLVAYLCSPLAAATTGAAVRIDGGVVPAIP